MYKADVTKTKSKMEVFFINLWEQVLCLSLLALAGYVIWRVIDDLYGYIAAILAAAAAVVLVEGLNRFRKFLMR